VTRGKAMINMLGAKKEESTRGCDPQQLALQSMLQGEVER